MFLRILMFLIGIFLNVVGIVSIVIYLNLLVNGYSFFEYVNFIIRRIECIGLVLGIILVYLSIYIGDGK